MLGVTVGVIDLLGVIEGVLVGVSVGLGVFEGDKGIGSVKGSMSSGKSYCLLEKL